MLPKKTFNTIDNRKTHDYEIPIETIGGLRQNKTDNPTIMITPDLDDKKKQVKELEKINEQAQKEALKGKDSDRKLITLKREEVQDEFNKTKKLTPKAFRMFIQNK